MKRYTESDKYTKDIEKDIKKMEDMENNILR